MKGYIMSYSPPCGAMPRNMPYHSMTASQAVEQEPRSPLKMRQ